jgi:hypothetical protein
MVNYFQDLINYLPIEEIYLILHPDSWNYKEVLNAGVFKPFKNKIISELDDIDSDNVFLKGFQIETNFGKCYFDVPQNEKSEILFDNFNGFIAFLTKEKAEHYFNNEIL